MTFLFGTGDALLTKFVSSQLKENKPTSSKEYFAWLKT
jgi:hypothetical protein